MNVFSNDVIFVVLTNIFIKTSLVPLHTAEVSDFITFLPINLRTIIEKSMIYYYYFFSLMLMFASFVINNK